MTEFESVQNIINLCEKRNVKRIKLLGIEVEFFEPRSEPMPLDPKALANILTESMPPDSAMLFASTEDMTESENPTSEVTEKI
jgi:hypothetical protein